MVNTLEENTRRFNKIQSLVKERESHTGELTARFNYKKEELNEKAKELKELGVTFTNIGELSGIFEDTKTSLEQHLTELETLLGIVDEPEEEALFNDLDF